MISWECPHCQVNVSLSEERLGSGWSFSQCSQCKGIAMVKRAQVNLIKTDKAPPGEPILRAEATSQIATPRAGQQLLGETANQRMAQYILNGKKPAMPTPLPEIPKKSKWIKKLLPFGLSASAAFVFLSGAYLFIEISKLNEKGTTAVQTIATKIVDQVPVQAAAPAQPSTKTPSESTPAGELWIRVRSEGANLFSGPGLEFPIVSSVNAKNRYHVLDWKDRWFKIEISSNQSGWVRNDLVQFIQ